MNDETQGMAGEGLWLGRLEKVNHLYGLMEPLAEWVDGGWVKVDRSNAVNTRIRVKPSDLGNTRMIESFWVFGIHVQGNSSEKHATKPARAIPIVDVSHLPLPEARHRLMNEGIHLPPHQARQVLALFTGGRCSVLRFEAHHRGLWIAKPGDGIVALQVSDPAWADVGLVRGFQYLPSGEYPQGPIVATLDWSSDAEVLSRVINRYRQALTSHSMLRAPSDESLFRRIERALTELRTSAGEGHEFTALVDRLREDWPRLARELGAIEEFRKLLLETEEGKALLAEAVSQREEELRPELETRARERLDADLASLREQLASHRSDAERERATITELRTQIESARADLARQTQDAEAARIRCANQQALLAEAEQALAHAQTERAQETERIRQAAEEEKSLRDARDTLRAEVRSFAEGLRDRIETTGSDEIEGVAAFANRLESLLHGAGESSAALLPSPIPPWWGGACAPQVSEITVPQLHESLATAARLHGLLVADLTLLDAFARAGEPVLLLGPSADVSLDAYARAISGGRVRRQVLDPSVIGLDDIWRIPATGRCTAFALAWQRAVAHPQETVLVCLSMLDASPFHLWASSLGDVLRGPDRPPNLLMVATACGGSAVDEQYPGAAGLSRIFVPLRPRADPKASVPAAALVTPVDARRLRWTTLERPAVDPAQMMTLAETGKTFSTIGRAVRLRLRLEEVGSADAQAISLAWTRYLAENVDKELPHAIVLGLEATESLHFRA